MKIFIDGDASPVKKETIALAAPTQLSVVIVTSVAHFSQQVYPKYVSVIYVDKGKEAADYRILQQIQAGDVLITQDYGLAALALQKGARVVHHTGKEYTANNIDLLLEQRFWQANVRKSGGRTKGPKAFTKADRAHFTQTLAAILEENKSFF